MTTLALLGAGHDTVAVLTINEDGELPEALRKLENDNRRGVFFFPTPSGLLLSMGALLCLVLVKAGKNNRYFHESTLHQQLKP